MRALHLVFEGVYIPKADHPLYVQSIYPSYSLHEMFGADSVLYVSTINTHMHVYVRVHQLYNQFTINAMVAYVHLHTLDHMHLHDIVYLEPS